MASAQPVRRRRRPEEAEREILDAAEELLRERPFRELSVDDLMARTTLSRPAFYTYFRDRHELVMQLVARLEADLMAPAERWLKGGPDVEADARAAIAGVVAVYSVHGPVLRAIADAATADPAVERTYRGLMRRFVDATRARIEEQQDAGLVGELDAARTAEALVWMNERYLWASFGQGPGTEPEAVVDTLVHIWLRVLYTAPP